MSGSSLDETVIDLRESLRSMRTEHRLLKSRFHRAFAGTTFAILLVFLLPLVNSMGDTQVVNTNGLFLVDDSQGTRLAFVATKEGPRLVTYDSSGSLTGRFDLTLAHNEQGSPCFSLSDNRSSGTWCLNDGVDVSTHPASEHGQSRDAHD